jgi:glucose/arabinose dehydrogenase
MSRFLASLLLLIFSPQLVLAADNLPIDVIDFERLPETEGKLGTNKSFRGGELKIAGRTYKTGYGVDAQSSLRISVGENADVFSGACGLDDAARGATSGPTICRVKHLNTILYQSPHIYSNQNPARFSIKLNGIKELTLETIAPEDPFLGGLQRNLFVDWVDLKASKGESMKGSQRCRNLLADYPSSHPLEPQAQIVIFRTPNCFDCFGQNDLFRELQQDSELKNLVRLHFVDIPQEGNQTEQLIVEAAYCAYEQKTYWSFWASVRDQMPGTYDELVELAALNGLDLPAFRTCMVSNRPKEHLAKSLLIHQSLAKSILVGKAMIYVNGELIQQGFESLTRDESLAAIKKAILASKATLDPKKKRYPFYVVDADKICSTPADIRLRKIALSQTLDKIRTPAAEVLIPSYPKMKANLIVRSKAVPVSKGLAQTAQMLFQAEDPKTLIAVQRLGNVAWVDIETGEVGTLLSVPLLAPRSVELGLVSLAFHPEFSSNKKLYLRYMPSSAYGGTVVDRISEVQLSSSRLREAKKVSERIIFQRENVGIYHKGAHMHFGPDGYLYFGAGDSTHGWRAQNKSAYSGSMLRIDVNKESSPKRYSIPTDNPFVGEEGAATEIWAIGLRNPWAFTFLADNRLLVADVGDSSREELSIVEKGKNYGWPIFEGDIPNPHTKLANRVLGSLGCKSISSCKSFKPIAPILTYSRQNGGAIFAGFVYKGEQFPQLNGKLVFSDWISANIWAIAVKDASQKNQKLKLEDAHLLGDWQMLMIGPVQSPTGEMYISDYFNGVLYRIDPDTSTN